jgi:hypothetical protein
MRIAIGMLMCLAGLSAGGAGAAEPASAPPKTTAQPATTGVLTDEEKRYLGQGYKLKIEGGKKYFCRRESPVGSHFSSTVCRTAETIRINRQNSRDAAEQAQQKALQTSNP